MVVVANRQLVPLPVGSAIVADHAVILAVHGGQGRPLPNEAWIWDAMDGPLRTQAPTFFAQPSIWLDATSGAVETGHVTIPVGQQCPVCR